MAFSAFSGLCALYLRVGIDKSYRIIKNEYEDFIQEEERNEARIKEFMEKEKISFRFLAKKRMLELEKKEKLEIEHATD